MFFSKSTLLYMRKSVETGQILCSHPYKWDREKHCFSIAVSWKRRAFWQFNFIFTIIYWIFMVIRCIQTATSETDGATIKVFSLSVTTLMALPVAFQSAFACNLRYFPSFVNSYLKFVRLEDNRYKHDEKARPMLSLFCDIVVVGCFWMFWLYCALWTIAAVVHPASPHVLSSIGLTSPLGIAFSTCLWLHFLYIFTANACFMSGTKFPWNFYILQVLQRQRKMQAGGLNDAMRSYRAAQILQRDYANSYSFVEAAIKVMLTIFAVTGFFGTIRLYGFIVVTLAVLATCNTALLIVIINLLASVHSTSSKILRRMKRLVMTSNTFKFDRWTLKRLRSLRLQFTAGELYTFRKITVIRVIQIIGENTILLLVNFRGA